jgi:hypothetical protein
MRTGATPSKGAQGVGATRTTPHAGAVVPGGTPGLCRSVGAALGPRRWLRGESTRRGSGPREGRGHAQGLGRAVGRRSPWQGEGTRRGGCTGAGESARRGTAGLGTTPRGLGLSRRGWGCRAGVGARWGRGCHRGLGHCGGGRRGGGQGPPSGRGGHAESRLEGGESEVYKL